MPNTTQPRTAPSEPAATDQARQLVSFSFYKLDPAWRRQTKDARRAQAEELQRVLESYRRKLLVLTYSLVGTRGDCDVLIWRVGTQVEQLQEMTAAINGTAMAGYLTMPHSYLSMTKRSTYVDKLHPEHEDQRRFITPANAKYLFVYPFVKTREWYLLPMEERQQMMDEHIRIGSRYASVRIHTTYSFGIDDQEFVVAFETDEPKDFLDLVMALRHAKGSPFTLRDTPIFTCVLKPFPQVLHDLGA